MAKEAAVAKVKTRMTTWDKNQMKWGWLFVAPTVIGLIVLNIYPMVMTVWQSLNKTGDFGKGNKFIGLANYAKMVQDAEVWQSLWNTFKYALFVVPVSVALSVVVAVLLNRKMKGRSVYRAIFFLPMVSAPAAVAMIWRWLYNSQYGLINHVFGTNVNWISDPNLAWLSIAIIGVWSALGYNVVLFLSGLQDIPKDYYEASSIDGATGVKQFFKITLPLLSPTIFFVVVTSVIGALQVFDLIFMVMDHSNPALGKTESIVYLFYQYSFTNGNKGYGSAIVMLLLAVILVLTAIQMKLQKKWVFYN